MGQASDCYTTRSSPCPSPVYSKHRETPGPLSVPHSSHRAVRSFLGGACLFFRRQKLFASTVLPPMDGHGRSSTGRIGGEMAWVAGSQPGCLGLLSPKLLPAVSETVPVSKVFPYIKDIKGGSPTEGIAARSSKIRHHSSAVQHPSFRLFSNFQFISCRSRCTSFSAHLLSPLWRLAPLPRRPTLPSLRRRLSTSGLILAPSLARMAPLLPVPLRHHALPLPCPTSQFPLVLPLT